MYIMIRGVIGGLRVVYIVKIYGCRKKSPFVARSMIYIAVYVQYSTVVYCDTMIGLSSLLGSGGSFLGTRGAVSPPGEPFSFGRRHIFRL